MKNLRDLSWPRLFPSSSFHATSIDSFPKKVPRKASSLTSLQRENAIAVLASDFCGQRSSDTGSTYTYIDSEPSIDRPVNRLAAQLLLLNRSALNETSRQSISDGLNSSRNNGSNDSLLFAPIPRHTTEKLLSKALENSFRSSRSSLSAVERIPDSASYHDNGQPNSSRASTPPLRIADARAKAVIIHRSSLPHIGITRPSIIDDSSSAFSDPTPRRSRPYSNTAYGTLMKSHLRNETSWSYSGSSDNVGVDGPAIEPPKFSASALRPDFLQRGSRRDIQSESLRDPNMHDLAHCATETPVLNTTVPMGIVQTIPVANGIPQNALISGRNGRASPLAPIPAIPGIPAEPPVLHGLPIDQTGMIPVPLDPKSNAKKRKKAKIRTQRVIRRTRKALLRKSLLRILLGRELAGPTYDSLTLIAKNPVVDTAATVVDTTSSVLPVSAPIPLVGK